MVKSLKRKFILVASLSVAAVFVLVIGLINLVTFIKVNQSTDTIIQILSENDGAFPPDFFPETSFGDWGGINKETPFATRYFTAIKFENNVPNDNDNIVLNMQKIASVTPSVAKSYVLMAKGDSGRMYDFKYRVSVKPNGDKFYVFLDCSGEYAVCNGILIYSIAVGVIGLIVALLLVLFFSNLALKPIVESYKKQSAFITNASHDIKTPLTIINAETELLELESGQNEYTGEIKKQIKRLTSLTEKLVFLSSMEEANNYPYTQFNLSDTLREICLSYSKIAKSQGLNFEENIDDNIFINANYELLTQSFTLILDNTLKYTAPNGNIRVWLKKVGSKTQIGFFNDVDGIEIGKHDEFFERFYRADKSRTHQKGNGIGLSVVKAIIDKHKGKIVAESYQGNDINFIITI